MVFHWYLLEVLRLNFVYWPDVDLSASIVSEIYNYRTNNVMCCSTFYVVH